ncbi:MAG: hypothetical protein Ct9H90mP13_08740 [Pseudomonadota bacterium]|nr:MAG: hypothetical protein Ct9H90mP13_08740 [Pseudomonadota bacterium]
MGLGRVESSKFSFLLAIPVIFAASVLQIYDLYSIGFSDVNYVYLLTGLTLSFFDRILYDSLVFGFCNENRHASPFFLYRVALGSESLCFCKKSKRGIMIESNKKTYYIWGEFFPIQILPCSINFIRESMICLMALIL